MLKTMGFGVLRKKVIACLEKQVWTNSESTNSLPRQHFYGRTSLRGNSTVDYASTSKAVSESPALSNKRARLELAVAYRVLDRYKLNEGICNHLSMVAPAARGDGDVMLIIPYGKHWSQVTSSCLLGVKDTGEVIEGEGRVETTASSIHRGLHRANQNATVVFHTHSPYITSLGVLKNTELLMCHQVSSRFYQRVAYDKNYEGYAAEVEEGQRLAGELGSKDVLMMCNHGVITTGGNVAMAFDLLYYFERACMYQMLAMATGRELSIIPDKQVKFNCDMVPYEEEQKYANEHFNSVMDVTLKETPDVAN